MSTQSSMNPRLFCLADDVLIAVCRFLTLSDLAKLSHCCTLARSVVGGHVVPALLLRPLLHIAKASATEASRHPWDDRLAEPGPSSFSVLVAIRCCIDLRCTFDIRGLDIDDAVTAIKSIPILFPIECLLSEFDELGEPLLDHLVTDAVNAYCGDGTVKPGFSIALVPFDIRFAFWKDLMETPKTHYNMYLLTRSFDPVQAEAAFNYLESRIRLFTESYDMVENEAMENKHKSYDSDCEYNDNEQVESMGQNSWLQSVLVEALVSLLPALAARSMEMVRQAWEHICVLVFTAKASFPASSSVPDCVSASSDWIVFWKQFVIRFLNPRDFSDASQFIAHLRYVDVDGVAEDTLLQAFQEREVNKSDMNDHRAFIVRQLRLLQRFCSVVNLEHAPKIIAALADIRRTIENLQFKGAIWKLLESCVSLLDSRLYKLLTALNGPWALGPRNVGDDKAKIKVQLDVEELVHFYIDVKHKEGVRPSPLALAVLPICGGKDLHLTYLRSTVKLKRKVDLTKLCSLLSGERFRTAFVLAIDMVWLELLDCLCQNKLELHHQKLLEHCIPILVSQLNKQKGVGKLISRLALDMNESMLIDILDSILLILPQYSLETSMDPDIHQLGFPAVIGALAQRGFSGRVQPLVLFLYNIIAHEYWMQKLSTYEECALILESVIHHLRPMKFADVALLWNRSHKDPEIFTETLARASAKQMAGLINTKSASISDVERLLAAALEHAQRDYHLRSGTLVMKVVRQLHQSVVGFPMVSPSITASLLSLLAAYSSQPGEIHNPVEVPDEPEVASPELDFVTQMLAPASGLVYEEVVASCLREVWVQATFCRSARFVYLTRSEEAGFGFRRVLSGKVISAWKDALERKEEWYMNVSFGERVKMLYKKYGLVWANE